MANHAIVLLTYIAEHPADRQTYRSLADATGIPRSTIWNLVNWDHFLAPRYGEPIFVWAMNLGFEVEVSRRPGILLVVSRSSI